MITKQLNNKWHLPIVLIFLLAGSIIHGQKSPYQIRIGYEQLYVSPTTTNGIAEKSWTWSDPMGDDLISFRTSLTHAYHLGLRYDVTNWWNVNLNFKKYYRKYYVWSGTYLQEEWEGNDPGQFEIVPYVYGIGLPSMFLGSTLATTSWQLGTDFHHRISKNGKWQMHYYLSLNRDLYESSLHQFDTPVEYEGNGAYFQIEDGKRIDYTTKGKLTFRSYNFGQSQFRASTNMALAISKKMKNGMGFRFEFGLRNIRWIKDNLLEENHWEIDLNHQRSFKDENDPDITHIYYDINAKHDFPLYLGGYYSNISFTFRPFRSPRDKEGYISPGNKIRKFINKIF